MKNNLDKVLKVFALMWAIAGVGFGVGLLIPPMFAIPLGILALVLLIISYFTKQDSILTKVLVLSIPFLLGTMSSFVITFYLVELGGGLFTTVVLTAIILFVVMGLFGFQLQKDLSWLGKILFFALLGLIVISVIVIFTGASNILMAVLSAFGVLIFLGFTMYDFNQIAQRGVSEDKVYHTALDLFLDLLNLILELLRLVYYLKSIFED